MKKSIAYLDWSLDVSCPLCGENIDLVHLDSDSGDYRIAKHIFENQWDQLRGWDISCPHCEEDFQLDRVEY